MIGGLPGLMLRGKPLVSGGCTLRPARPPTQPGMHFTFVPLH